MPYENEHSCRLNSPEKYDKFRRKNCAIKHDGKCIDVIYGIKNNESEIQAMRYNKTVWTEDEARAHCKNHDGQFEPAKKEDKKMGDKKIELRTAIAPHHTGVVDNEWDGPTMVARLKSDEDASYYNGGRGGADIPDSERQGVYSHLATHLRDADYTPPELKSNKSTDIERRAFMSEIVVSHRDNESPKIVGHAAVFNKPSLPLFGFREQIMPGAFTKTILEDDIRALWNHNPDYVLGRNKAGTLRLTEDEFGLRIEIDPPKTSFATDLIESIRRGDVDQMSFGFITRDEKFTETNGELIRTLLDVQLFDVSPVTFPAYPQTDVAVRSMLSDVGIDFERLVKAIKNPVQESRYIGEVIQILQGILPVQENNKIALLRKKLELIEKS